MYRLAIFDLDGTLLDTLEDISSALNLARRDMGLPPLSKEHYRLYAGSGPHRLMQGMLPELELDHRLVQEGIERYRIHYSNLLYASAKPFPGVVDMLRELRRHKVVTGLFSNKPHEIVLQQLERYFPGLLDLVQGRSSGVPPKPDPTVLHSFARRCGVSTDACLYIGDMDVDIETAIAAGMLPVAVMWGFVREQLTSREQTVYVSTAEELTQLILTGR